MDIDTALNLIREIPEGYIVWQVDNGEIVRVIPFKEEDDPKKRFADLPRTINGRVIEYVGGPYQPNEITRSYLEQAQAEYIKVHLRITMFTDWARQSAEQLVTVLETGDYPPAGNGSDDHILIEYLFEFHWQELNQVLRNRLWHLLDTDRLKPLAILILKLYLLTLEQKKDRFITLWMEEFHEKTTPYHLAMKCAGDLQITDATIINDLIQTIKSNVLFIAKHQAMIALGRIGVAAGEQATQVIEEVIYESNPEVGKQRELALKRIRTSPYNWVVCGSCHNGIAQYFVRYARASTCETCYGFGFIWNGKME
jgi:hypothetical protein